MNAVAEAPALTPPNAKSVKSVLFVCTGNTCRSPMAAAWLTSHGSGKGFVADSAGLFPVPGAPISANAVAALKAAGVDPSPDNRYDLHTARPVDERLVAAADAVVGITQRHAMQLMFDFPQYAGKIVSMPRDIPDPFGGSENDYRVCLDELIEGIKELFFLED